MINRKTLVLYALMILCLLGLMIYSMSQFATPFVPIKDLKTNSGRLQVKGCVVNRSIQWNPAGTELRFNISEENHTVPVSFSGEKPNGLEGGRIVVVVGAYDGNEINATKILVKCPTKYKEE